MNINLFNYLFWMALMTAVMLVSVFLIMTMFMGMFFIAVLMFMFMLI